MPKLWTVLLLAAAGCGSFLAEPTATPTATHTATATSTATPTATWTPLPALTPTVTLTPSMTPSSTVTMTATFDFPDGIVKVENGFCRYGPDTAYLHAWGLKKGDHVVIHNRNFSGQWLWVKPDAIDYHCWVAASLLDIDGDIKSVVVLTDFYMPSSSLYGPVKQVYAHREGNQVTISWEPVWMTEDDDRGYLMEVYLCQNGAFFWDAVQTDKTSHTFTDDAGCAGQSGGLLYVVEKHGYTTPVTIPWPAH